MPYQAHLPVIEHGTGVKDACRDACYVLHPVVTAVVLEVEPEYPVLPQDEVPEAGVAFHMPGLVVDVKVEKGDYVFRGQDLVTIESMKMESGVSSPCDGQVEEISIQVGQTVETGDIMITFKS